MENKKGALSLLLNAVFYLFLILVLAGSFLFAASKDERKSIFGYRFYEALSGSMSPEIKKGDIVVVKLTPPEQIAVGDVVTYQAAGFESGSEMVTVTHRVVEKNAAGGEWVFTTKGDASPDADDPISENRIIGKVVFNVPLIGIVLGVIRERPVPSMIFAVLIVVLISCLRYVFRKDTAETVK